MRNKRIIISVGTLSLLVASPLFAISCSDNNQESLTSVTITGEDIVVVDLRNDSIEQLVAANSKINSWRNTQGKHFAVKIHSKVTSRVETYVYAVKNTAQGYDASKTWEQNSIALSRNNSTAYNGYKHIINNAEWVYTSDFHELEREFSNSMEIDENDERIIKFETSEIKTANLATLTQPQALAYLQEIDVDKASIGKHTAYKIIDGDKSSMLVYAVKNEHEGFYETIGQNYLLDFDESGYAGYTHMIQNANGTFSEWHHDMGFYTYLGRIRQIAYPQTTKAIPAEDQYTIDLPNLTEAEALAKYNEIETLKNTKGKHIAVIINSATTTGTTGTMVYAVKNDNEGYNASSTANLLKLEGTGYKGYTHTINGVTWVNTNEVLVLIKEWRMKAGIEPTVVSKTLTGEDLMSIDLTTATAMEAKEFLIKMDARQNTPGSHLGVKIRSKTAPTLTGIMVYATKSTTEGFVVGASAEANRLPFSGSGYTGYEHIIDGTIWGHNQNYYGPLAELRGLAMQHNGVTDIHVTGSNNYEIDLRGLSQADAIVWNNKIQVSSKVPGNHYAITFTGMTGTKATQVYAIKTVADGFDPVLSVSANIYNTVGGETGKYEFFDHYVGVSTTTWAHDSAYYQLLGIFNGIVNRPPIK